MFRGLMRRFWSGCWGMGEGRIFPLVPLKTEGAAVHPDELDYECDCRRCVEHRAEQLAAYEAYWASRWLEPARA